MKFLYFGDRHATYKNPSNRLDDFQLTCENKDKEIMEIARREKVSAILQPGDFFEEKDIKGDNKFIGEIIERYGLFNLKKLLEEYQKTGKIDLALLENYIPMVCVAGNHDLIGESEETLPNTTLGLLSSLGQLNLVTKDNPMYFYTEDGLKVAITGTNYHIGMDEPFYRDDYIVEDKLGDIHIHIVHGMLSDKDMGKLIKHTLIDNIKETKADITLCGHNHIGFGILKVDEKYFVNIGSITRYTGDIKEIKRIPSVALIDISKDGIKIDNIPLKSAPDGASVIDRSEIEALAKKKAAIKSFKDDLKTMKSSGKKLELSDFVDAVVKHKAIDDETRDDIIKRINDAEDIKAKVKSSLSGGYVSKIILENFQSHEYTEIDLSKGFNVFVGESRQGKSAIERAFYWVYENEPKGNGFIKRGADFARVTIELSTGLIVSRMVEAKKNGKNIYEIITPEGEIQSGNTKLLPEVQRLLGFNNFYIDSKLSFPINFYKQGSSWYLIGDKLTRTDKARVIGALVGTNTADAIIRTLDSENNKVLNTNKYALDSISNIEKELDSLKDLEDLKKIVENNETLIKKYNELKAKKEKIEKVLNNLKDYNEKLLMTQEILKNLENIPNISLNIEKYKNIYKDYDSLIKIFDNYNISSKNLEETKNILKNLENVSNDLNRIDSLKKSANNHHLLNKYLTNYKAYIHNSKINKNILLSLKDIELLGIKLSKLNRLNEKLLNISKEYEKYLKLVSNNDKNKSILEDLKDLDTISINLNKILELNSLLENITKLKNNLDLSLKEQKEVTEVLNKLVDTFKVKNLLENFNELNVVNDKLTTSYITYIETFNKLEKAKEDKKKAEEIESKERENYANLLKEMQICPLCKTPLEDEQINHIIEKEN